ncbi:MAG: reverse transcriptase/maturase family protein [bacterium]
MYDSITSTENILEAWQEFLKGKKNKEDVQKFQYHLLDNVLSLSADLKNKTYTHGEYKSFKISDPKPRDIHKSSVRDRLLHHAIYRILYPYFDKKFIHDSYSCRLGKGTHKANERFKYFTGKVSRNYTRACWILKCDIRKFFANIDHNILMQVLEKHIDNKDTVWLLGQVIKSFNTKGRTNVGLPLGNLTSQLLVNIYMNEFDQFVKHSLREKYYIRYADDFVFMSEDKSHLEGLISKISEFLENNLKLRLHPDKLFIKTLSSGLDFLGWVHFEKHKVLRTATKKRMFRNLVKKVGKKETIQSYLGLLKHGNTRKIKQKILKQDF